MEEVSVLIGRSQSGDKEAREVLIEKNLGLVHHIVKRFLGRGYDPEDLFQIGVIGLMKAIDKFDLKLETKESADPKEAEKGTQEMGIETVEAVHRIDPSTEEIRYLFEEILIV